MQHLYESKGLTNGISLGYSRNILEGTSIINLTTKIPCNEIGK
jgi:hypothetical protein